MKKIHQGQTQNTITVKVLNPNTQGKGKTGITASALHGMSYWRENDFQTFQITPVDGVLGTWASGSWVEINSIYNPGEYAVGLPDAMFASGARRVVLCITFTDGGSPDADIEIELDQIDYQDGNAAGLLNLKSPIAETS